MFSLTHSPNYYFHLLTPIFFVLLHDINMRRCLGSCLATTLSFFGELLFSESYYIPVWLTPPCLHFCFILCLPSPLRLSVLSLADSSDRALTSPPVRLMDAWMRNGTGRARIFLLLLLLLPLRFGRRQPMISHSRALLCLFVIF